MGAHGAGYLSDGNGGNGLLQPLPLPDHLLPPQRQLQAECRWLGVDPMGAAHHGRIPVGHRRRLQDLAQLVKVFSEDAPCLQELQAQGGIDNVAGGQSQVEPPPLGSQALGNGPEEGRDIVTGALEYLLHALVVVPGRSQALHVLRGDDPLLGPGLADCQLHLEPFAVLGLVGPDQLHGRPRVAVYHRPVLGSGWSFNASNSRMTALKSSKGVYALRLSSSRPASWPRANTRSAMAAGHRSERPSPA